MKKLIILFLCFVTLQLLHAAEVEDFDSCTMPAIIRHGVLHDILFLNEFKKPLIAEKNPETDEEILKPDCEGLLRYVKNNIKEISFNAALSPGRSSPRLTVSAEDLAMLPLLEDLYISGADIPVLSKDFFVNNPNIRDLTIRDSNTTTVAAGVFEGLKKLKFLNLSYNPISDFSENPSRGFSAESFRGLDNLVSLDLSKLHITTIPTNFFIHMPQLKFLMLDGNKGCSLEETSCDGVYIRKDSFFLATNIESITATDASFVIDEPSVESVESMLKVGSNYRYLTPTDVLSPLIKLKSLYINDVSIWKKGQRNKTKGYMFEARCGLKIVLEKPRQVSLFKYKYDDIAPKISQCVQEDP